MSSFKVVTEFNTNYSPSKITKYESTRTGMTAVVIDRKGPKVYGYFTLATEILDDSGAPHTLEHLVFMGSKNYQYKGVLDQLATRAYSETNAWTANDHTAYTMESAGWAGFAQILPIYLEHVLFPTLTDAGCYTEVRHIDGTGQDAGVVFSEMQGVENSAMRLISEAGDKMLYPEGIGFRYETGGKMDALRVLTADRIRQFHKEMYQPKNLCVIVVGEVDHKELLEVLEKFEDSILKEVPRLDAPWRRPWVESKPVPPLTKSSIATVEFPEKDESMGEVYVMYLGPNCMDPLELTAVEVLGTYLAGSSVSVLEKALVEIDEPWASSTQFWTEDRPNTVITIGMTAVETAKLEDAEKELMKVLKETTEKPLNFKYLQQLVRREKRQKKLSVESSGHTLPQNVISDHLFGNRNGGQLRNSLEKLDAYDELEKWNESQWNAFLKKYLVDNHHVSILGRPSAKLAKKIEEDDKRRVEERVQKLGEAGLKNLQKALDDAKAENDKPVPEAILGQLKVPSVDTIHFIETLTAEAGYAKKIDSPSKENVKTEENKAQKIIDADDPKAELPLYLHFEHVPTEFVQINLFISTGRIPVTLRPLISIYCENFFNTPVMKDGARVEYEDVVSQLEEDTIEYEIGTGHNVDLSESIKIKFQIEPEKYSAVIKWIKILMRDCIFDVKRLSVMISKLLSDIPEEKREGDSMSASIYKMIQLKNTSLRRAQDTLVKARYLKRINALLKENPDELIRIFKEFQEHIVALDAVRVLVIANLENLKYPVTAWKSFVEKNSLGSLQDLDRQWDRLTAAGQAPGGVSHIVPIASIDSSWALHSAVGPKHLWDPQLAPLMLVLAYMGVTEGPLWKAARGSGLAYGVSISRRIESGHVVLDIYRSPDAYKAYAAVKKVIQGYADGSTPFEKHALEGALSSIVVHFADNGANMHDAGIQSFTYQVVHGVPKNYNHVLLKRIQEVTEDQMREALREIIMPLFDPTKSNVFVVASPTKAPDILEQFKDDGFKPNLGHLKDFEDDYGLKYGLKDGEKDQDDQNDEDDEDDEDGSDNDSEDGSSDDDE